MLRHIGRVLLVLGGALLLSVMLLAAVIAAVLSDEETPDITMDENLPQILTQEMIIGAMESEATYGVPASLTLAQIILESGGSYPGGLSQLAYECHNLFGMKGIGPAGYAEYATGEQTKDGQTYTITAKFRKYHNVRESIDDHGQLLSGPYYKGYTAACKSSDDWARAIHTAGYATAIDYSSRLIELMRQYNLYQYDGGGLLRGNGIYTGRFLWPTVTYGVITSYFGYRDAPTEGASTYHGGIDIAADSGAPIYAAEGGQVLSAGDSGGGGGYMIVIEHSKTVKTSYMHLRQDGVLVKKGQRVSRGQMIGKMGTTGVSTGTHLDFRIYINDVVVDPLKYVTVPEKYK